jgi:uncharacterized membrane protein YebE (DUF533 family)
VLLAIKTLLIGNTKMQKLVNAVALLSGLVSLSVVAGGTYLFLNKDAMIEDVRVKITAEVTKAVTDALPKMVDSAMPELPTSTGNVIESKPAIPGL